MTLKNQKGITLIEIMITVAIVAAVTAIAVPNYLSWKPHYVFQSATSKIKHDLMAIRMKAIEKQHQYRMVICNDATAPCTASNSYFRQEGSKTSGTDWGTVTTLATVFDLNQHPNVVFAKNCQGDDLTNAISFYFYPRGTAWSSGSFYMVHNDTKECKQVTLSTAGRIQVK